MRVSSLLAVVGLLAACATLTSCACFCDDGELQPYDPLGRSVPPPEGRMGYDEHGRRCLDASIFDVIGGFAGADQAP